MHACVCTCVFVLFVDMYYTIKITMYCMTCASIQTGMQKCVGIHAYVYMQAKIILISAVAHMHEQIMFVLPYNSNCD